MKQASRNLSKYGWGWLLLIGFTAICGLTSIASAQSGEVCYLPYKSYKMKSAELAKCCLSGLVQWEGPIGALDATPAPSAKPKHFLRQSNTYTESHTFTNNNNEYTLSINNWKNTRVWNADTHVMTYLCGPGDVSGTYTERKKADGCQESNKSATYQCVNSQPQWTPLANVPPPFDTRQFNSLCAPYNPVNGFISPQGTTYPVLNVSESGANWGQAWTSGANTWSSTASVIRTDEFDTPMLYQKVQAALSNQSWESVSTACAYHNLTDDDASLGMGEFTFQYFSPSETVYRYTFHWIVRTYSTDFDGPICAWFPKSYTDYEQTYSVDGTGNWVNTPLMHIGVPADGTYKRIVAAWVCAKPRNASPGDLGAGGGARSPGIGWPGGSECAPCCGGNSGGAGGYGSGTVSLDGVALDLNLGVSEFARLAGMLSIRESAPGPQVVSKAAVLYRGEASDTEVLTATDGTLDQVKSKQTLANITLPSANTLKVDFYQASLVGAKTGTPLRYPVVGLTPVVTWTVVAPNGSFGNYNTILINEIRGASTLTSQYVWNVANRTWILTRPGALVKERQSTVIVAFSNDPLFNFVEYKRVSEVLDPTTGTVLEVHTKTYREGSNKATRLIEEEDGTGDTARKTSYSYTNTGELEHYVDYTGAWKRYIYDEDVRYTNVPPSVPEQFIRRLNTVKEGIKNIAWDVTNPPADSVLKVTEYGYDCAGCLHGSDYGASRPWLPRREIVKYLGTEVSRLERQVTTGEIVEERFSSPSSTWNSAENLKRVTVYETTGASAGRVKNISVDDGTRTFYTNTVASGLLTTIVVSGWPASQTDILLYDVMSKGTRTTTVTADDGRLISSESVDIASGLRTDYRVYSNFDNLGRAQTMTSGAGITGVSPTTETYQFDCCGISSVTARDGSVTTYVYDLLKRLTQTSVGGVTSINNFGPNGRISSTQRRGADNSVMTLASYVYDDAGRLIQETDAAGAITKYSELPDLTVPSPGYLKYYLRKSTQAFGQAEEWTTVQKSYADGQVFESLVEYPGSVPANADDFGNPTRRDYGIEAGEYFEKTTRLSTDGGTEEWTKVFTDFLGRRYKTRIADSTTGTESDNPVSIQYYNFAGERVKQVDLERPDLPMGNSISTLFSRENFNTNYVVVDVNKDGVRNETGSDRITKSVSDVVSAYGTTVRRVRTYVFPTGIGATDSDGWLSCVETRVDGLQSWSRQRNYTPSYLQLLTRDTTVLNGGGQITKTTDSADNSSSVVISQYGRTLSVTRKDSTAAQLGQVTYVYDPHGRQWKVTDTRTGTTTFGYDAADRVISVKSPSPGNGQAAQVSTTGYDILGRVTSVTEPDGLTKYTRYFRSGQVKLSWGARTYPVGYTYDSQGRMLTTLTWQSFVPPLLTIAQPEFPDGSTTTTWNYESWSGRLQNKRYADNKGPDYTYTLGGRLKTRRWWRTATHLNPSTDQTTSRLTTTYKYGFDDGTSGNDHGDLVETSYSNDPQNTLRLTYSYDRRGNQTQVEQGTSGSVTVNRGYNDIGQLRTEGQVGGDLDGIMVTADYDAFLRRSSLKASRISPAVNYVSYLFAYDNASRLLSVTDDMTSGTTYSATYARVPNSELISSVTFKENSTTRLTTTKSYDYLNRLGRINNQPGSITESPISYDYMYNEANQRTRMTLQDNSYWSYEYDSMGQVTKGTHMWPDSAVVPGQQFEYAYDAIGNRTGASGTRSGGDSVGANLRSTGYTPNSLNQYGSRANHRYLEVQGGANATVASVTAAIASGSPVNVGYRRGEYFRHEWNVAGTNFAWQNASINVTGGTAQTGNLYLHPAIEQFVYDGDGNMISDGHWTNKWDGENRIVQVMTTLAAFDAGVPGRRINYSYDYHGRIAKRVTYTGNPRTDSWAVDSGSETRMLYDGWQCIAELNSSKVIQRGYMWGIDLSGSTTGAGGVGGLLTIRSPANGIHCVGYDGNGNVAALVKCTDGTIGARYEYDAFGNTIRKTGTAIVQENPWEFSTKRKDKVSGMCIYEYRQLNPIIGKWMSRDPIGTLDGPSIYAFIRNDSVNASDYFGLCQALCGFDVTTTLFNTLQEVSRTFSMWKRSEKREACMRLTPWRIKGLATAWDIPFLKSIGQNVVPPHLNQDLFDPEPCRRTVTVSGKCYYGGSVNYVMYGHAFKLCNAEFPPPFSGTGDFTQRGMELNIIIWKGGIYEKFEEEEQQALDFAVSAYTGTMRATYGLPCTPNRTRVKVNSFVWNWAPHHERYN